MEERSVTEKVVQIDEKMSLREKKIAELKQMREQLIKMEELSDRRQEEGNLKRQGSVYFKTLITVFLVIVLGIVIANLLVR